jgi:hypothetical protein
VVEKRRYQRFETKQDVYLYHGVSKYAGRLENISCSGALVEVFSPLRLMQPGDMCYLAFVTQPDAILCACTVVRMLSLGVGLQFDEPRAVV